MAGRTAVTAPGHPTQHALALRDTDSASVCRLQERGGWAGSHGMLRSSSWGWSWAESSRCLLIPETCSPGTPLPHPAGTHQRDKDPQVQESKTSLNLQSHQHPSPEESSKGAGGPGTKTRERVGEVAQHQTPPLPAVSRHPLPQPSLLPTSSCHPQQ